jgi:Mg/Co/Ni transporter MgtE
MATLSLRQFAEEYLLRTGRRYFFVTDGDEVLGLVTVHDLQRVARAKWPMMRVGDIMRPFADLYSVPPDASARSVLELLGREGISQVPVIDHGQIQGVISQEDFVRLLITNRELGPRHKESSISGNSKPSLPSKSLGDWPIHGVH